MFGPTKSRILSVRLMSDKTLKYFDSTVFDAGDVCRILAESLKTCLNPPRGRGGKRIGTLASEDAVSKTNNNLTVRTIDQGYKHSKHP